jgi:hypothetical protein
MEQLGGDLAVMGLTGGPAEPDRSPAPVYEHVDFGPECARQATDTMIPTRPFSFEACKCARTEALPIIRCFRRARR